jgi:hypothetical protein
VISHIMFRRRLIYELVFSVYRDGKIQKWERPYTTDKEQWLRKLHNLLPHIIRTPKTVLSKMTNFLDIIHDPSLVKTQSFGYWNLFLSSDKTYSVGPNQ